jgi:DNA-binding SARP family transcriptional activator
MGAQTPAEESNELERPDSTSTLPPSPVMICVLGNFRLLVGGELVPIRAGGKSEALLALLALQFGRRIAQEQLLQAVWPEREPALARTSLRVLLYELSKLLRPALQDAAPVQHSGGYYWLNTKAGIGVDVSDFDRLVDTGNQQIQAGDTAGALRCYERAAQLYRNDLQLASDVHLVMERERLRARYLTLLAQLAEQCYQAGSYGDALAYLWRLLARDPYREDAHRLVMRCYIRRGERAAALHQYQLCADLLRTNFDAAPETATAALFEQIRNEPDLL